MSDLDSQIYAESKATLDALGKTGLPALAIFSPANRNSPIVLHSAWTKSTLLEQLNIVIEENQGTSPDRSSTTD
ncbi:MAG: hypothetical protein VB858_14080 [Planctomycetaceae bacterium]|jgi:hypothetical protein